MSKPDNNTQAFLRYLLDSRLRGNDACTRRSKTDYVIPAQAGIQEMSQNAQIACSGGSPQRKGILPFTFCTPASRFYVYRTHLSFAIHLPAASE